MLYYPSHLRRRFSVVALLFSSILFLREWIILRDIYCKFLNVKKTENGRESDKMARHMN
jgi:hypothetical protein